jgi:predicted phosphodiesterase
MKYYILSDIHSNLEALEAVLDDAGRRGKGRFVILGDVIGYGASPNEVIERIRELEQPLLIRGNHDRVIRQDGMNDEFNAAAQAAVMWTKNLLSEESRRFIEALREGPIIVDDVFMAAHGTPLNEDDYIFSEYDAMDVFMKTDFRICFFGHTHYPIIFVLEGDAVSYYFPRKGEVKVKIEEGPRYLLNPGSIGQPRDRNPDASYALYDSDEDVISFLRVPYDVEKAKEKILKAGLPAMLATRLSFGL